MRRWLFRFLVLVVVLVVVLFIGLWLALRGSLPEYDGERLVAVTAPVKIERDDLGSVTVRASNRRDAAWAIGYAHAQERYFEMDLLRRSAAGELAELFGPAALPRDRRVRPHRMRARVQAALAQAPEADRALIDAYRDGVNAGLSALAVRPFAYLATGSVPAPWRSEDSLLAVAAMYFNLNDADNRRELAFSRMHAALAPAAYAFLTAAGGGWDAPLAGSPLDWPRLPTREELDLSALDPALLHGSEPPPSRVPGSNAFAVSGQLTGGAALVADDMHLDLQVPALWFRTRVVYPNPRRVAHFTDVSGATLPGAPAIVVGSNRDVAWGFTNSYGDFTDWVRVVAADDGTPPAITTQREVLHVAGAADEVLDVRESAWGPILAEDADGTPLALAWTAHRPDAINLELARLDQAETVDEAVEIAHRAGIPAQNFVVGDRHGNIAWTIAGRIPRRIGGYDPLLPSAWRDGAVGWDGWLAPESYPLVANPPWQRIWSANARMVEGPALDVLGDGGYDLGARQRQIRDGLRARSRFAPADMLAIQLDDRALFLAPWHERLVAVLAAASSTTDRDALRAALGDWNGRASIDSVAYRMTRAWRDEVIARVLDGFAAAVRQRYPDFELPKMPQAEHVVAALLHDQPPHLLPPGVASWDALLLISADRVAARYAGQPGGIAARTWGERNTARIQHPLARFLPPSLAAALSMPAQPLPGDANMPRVQAPSFGASERFAVSPGDEENGYFELPGGQSGHPLSPYFGAGHADWAAGRPTPFLPGPAAHQLHLLPATR